MSEMSEKETLERFDEGLKMAVSRAKELAQAQQNEGWVLVGIILERIRTDGLKLAKSKGITQQSAEAMIKAYLQEAK